MTWAAERAVTIHSHTPWHGLQASKIPVVPWNPSPCHPHFFADLFEQSAAPLRFLFVFFRGQHDTPVGGGLFFHPPERSGGGAVQGAVERAPQELRQRAATLPFGAERLLGRLRPRRRHAARGEERGTWKAELVGMKRKLLPGWNTQRERQSVGCVM